MRAQLHVHGGDPGQPERAASLVARELLSSCPRQRPVTLAILALGPHPGLTPTPWVLDGLFAALIEAERTPINFITIGDHETGEALLRKAGREGPVRGSELIERPSRDRKVDLRVGDHRRPLTIPREIIGSSLILCAPLCLFARDAGSARRWQGPLASLLAAFALGHGFCPTTPKLRAGLRPREDRTRERAAAAVGHELFTASFAESAVILDATWAGALDSSAAGSALAAANSSRARGRDGRLIKVPKLSLADRAEPSAPALLGELAAPERVLGLGGLGRLELAALLGVDRFLAAALGLDARPPAHEL
uniref:hypothetical protein n=1 Tax=Enhygromyxa salina TaxID=215803 RepID=UPI001C633F22